MNYYTIDTAAVSAIATTEQMNAVNFFVNLFESNDNYINYIASLKESKNIVELKNNIALVDEVIAKLDNSYDMMYIKTKLAVMAMNFRPLLWNA